MSLVLKIHVGLDVNRSQLTTTTVQYRQSKGEHIPKHCAKSKFIFQKNEHNQNDNQNLQVLQYWILQVLRCM